MHTCASTPMHSLITHTHTPYCYTDCSTFYRAKSRCYQFPFSRRESVFQFLRFLWLPSYLSLWITFVIKPLSSLHFLRPLWWFLHLNIFCSIVSAKCLWLRMIITWCVLEEGHYSYSHNFQVVLPGFGSILSMSINIYFAVNLSSFISDNSVHNSARQELIISIF